MFSYSFGLLVYPSAKFSIILWPQADSSHEGMRNGLPWQLGHSNALPFVQYGDLSFPL